MADLSSETIPVVQGVIVCNIFLSAAAKKGSIFCEHKTEKSCTGLTHVIHSTVLMGEEEQGEAAGMTTYSRQAWLPWRQTRIFASAANLSGRQGRAHIPFD